VWACGVQSEFIDHESEGSALPAPEAVGEHPVAEPDVTKLTRRRKPRGTRSFIFILSHPFEHRTPSQQES